MKILHTADWHLGKRLDRFDRMPEQIQVLEEIVEITNRENPDVILVAGDLFDTFNPAVEAVELLYRTLRRLSADGKRAVIAIAGNHDSPERVEVPDIFARELGIIFAGYPDSLVPVFQVPGGISVLNSEKGFVEIKLSSAAVPLRILLTPYANEWRLKESLGLESGAANMTEALSQRWKILAEKHCNASGVNMLISHLFFMRSSEEKPEEPEEERSILIGGATPVLSGKIPAAIQYTALGHLHRFQVIDEKNGPVVYSGSPLNYSFAEAGQEKYVVMVDVEPGKKAKFSKIALTSGLTVTKKRFTSVVDAILWLKENPDSIVELSIETETFLTAEDRRELAKAHSRIVGPIPILTGESGKQENETAPDLNLGMEEMFSRFFQGEKGVKPSADILEIFREVVSEKGGQE